MPDPRKPATTAWGRAGPGYIAVDSVDAYADKVKAAAEACGARPRHSRHPAFRRRRDPTGAHSSSSKGFSTEEQPQATAARPAISAGTS